MQDTLSCFKECWIFFEQDGQDIQDSYKIKFARAVTRYARSGKTQR
jgi:hypothetical protein